MAAVKVRFSDLDPYGHVNHSVYLTYFELGRAQYLQDAGLSLTELLDEGVQLVVVSADVSYKAPIRQGEVEVESKIVQTRKASMVWSQSLTYDGVLAATAEVRIASVGTDGKPIPLPSKLLG